MPDAVDDAGIAAKYGIERSPDWDKVRKAYLEVHGACVVCGQKGELNVHHMHPFHYVVACGRPDLELDPRNFITLCVPHEEQHHILLGHLDDYESYNPQVVAFASRFKGKDSAVIRADPHFKSALASKPKHLGDMSDAEKAAFKASLDQSLPVNPTVMAEALAARARVKK